PSTPLPRPSDRRQPFGQPSQPAIALVSSRIHPSRLDGLPYCASGLTHVPAVEEATPGREARHFDEPQVSRLEIFDGGREVAHPRRIDEPAAAGELVEPRHGRGMAPLLIAH